MEKPENEVYKLRTLEVAGDIYENVEAPGRVELIEAIQNNKVIAIYEKGKKIYINGAYIVSFEECKEGVS